MFEMKSHYVKIGPDCWVAAGRIVAVRCVQTINPNETHTQRNVWTLKAVVHIYNGLADFDGYSFKTQEQAQGACSLLLDTITVQP